MDSKIFETLSPTKLFFRCAIPSMITMAFGALYQIADGLFVGRFIGSDALAAINLIKETIGIESLEESLQELCLIRLANPDEPLEKLRQLYSEPVSKSGINHRFSKILKIADQIKNNKE